MTDAALTAVPTAIAWKIQGNLGGEDIADTARGATNAGGLYGERHGWNLPGYPDAAWATTALPASTAAAGTSWYRTSFDLNIPAADDASLGGDDRCSERVTLFGELAGAHLRQRLERRPVHSQRRPAAHLRRTQRNPRPARPQHARHRRDQRRRSGERVGNGSTDRPRHGARRRPGRDEPGARMGCAHLGRPASSRLGDDNEYRPGAELRASLVSQRTIASTRTIAMNQQK